MKKRSLERIRRFNSRTREGCDVAQGGADHWDEVSIHAPARGATSLSSIPSGLFDKFQFTHPRGVRPSDSQSGRCRLYVSIHAPTRGATASANIHTSDGDCFNSRTHEGCDRYFFGGCISITGFNSRTHEGCDVSCSIPKPSHLGFQFTHPRGVRLSLDYAVLCHTMFQFTHPRGVRHGCNLALGDLIQFQFTHPRGVRLAPASS